MVEYRFVEETELLELIRLSLKIFKPTDGEKNSHHQSELWKQHLDEGGFIIGLYVNGKLVGYNFGYPKDEKEFHYWMGGVLENFRGKGYGRELLERQEKMVKDRGFTEITVNTYEHMWPVQFGFLQRHGYKVYKTEEQVWDGKKVIKSFLRKDLF